MTAYFDGGKLLCPASGDQRALREAADLDSAGKRSLFLREHLQKTHGDRFQRHHKKNQHKEHSKAQADMSASAYTSSASSVNEPDPTASSSACETEDTSLSDCGLLPNGSPPNAAPHDPFSTPMRHAFFARDLGPNYTGISLDVTLASRELGIATPSNTPVAPTSSLRNPLSDDDSYLGGTEEAEDRGKPTRKAATKKAAGRRARKARKSEPVPFEPIFGRTSLPAGPSEPSSMAPPPPPAPKAPKVYGLRFKSRGAAEVRSSPSRRHSL
jgi:hypothetical protein